jgi:BirA family biotin operon repressor/biotin-[acetyl-CoA-carboxylase] ligase
VIPRVGAGRLGGPLLHLDTTGSTNDRARELAQAGAPDGTVVLAESQTAGRGRQGRSWQAPRGSALTLSAIVRLPADQLPKLPVSAALAVCEACEQLAPVEAQIKWPNDVWVNRRKVAGILIESRPQQEWAVIGFGVNVSTERQQFAPELRDSATSLLLASGEPIDRDSLLVALLDALARRRAHTLPQLLDEYRSRDALWESSISWGDGTGVAKGIDERGNLVVFTDAGEQVTLDAGEVHLDNTASR